MEYSCCAGCFSKFGIARGPNKNSAMRINMLGRKFPQSPNCQRFLALKLKNLKFFANQFNHNENVSCKNICQMKLPNAN